MLRSVNTSSIVHFVQLRNPLHEVQQVFPVLEAFLRNPVGFELSLVALHYALRVLGDQQRVAGVHLRIFGTTLKLVHYNILIALLEFVFAVVLDVELEDRA